MEFLELWGVNVNSEMFVELRLFELVGCMYIVMNFIDVMFCLFY